VGVDDVDVDVVDVKGLLLWICGGRMWIVEGVNV
jgi:hypothetical protein